MNTKNLVIGTTVVGLALAGIYYWCTKDEAETTQPEKKETAMSNADTTLDEMMLSSSKVMYQDVLKSYTDKVEREEQLQRLMVQLIYAHLNARDCTNDVNRTYVDWLRKMQLPNAEHYESIIRHCADNNLLTMGAITGVIHNHTTGMMVFTKQQVTIEVPDLNGLTSLEEISKLKLAIPVDEYTLKVESILDIPVTVILTGQKNVITLKEVV